jgi:hypothetical protein
MYHFSQRTRAEFKVVVAAWGVGIAVWLGGMAGLVAFGA